jgi:gliding motility-associated-like protein
MTSNATCVLKPVANSNPITMTITSVDPDVTIAASSNTICLGSSVTFTATPENGGSNPKYQWKVNGVNAGTNSNTFTSSTLNNGDVITVRMTSNATCIINPVATSNPVKMTVSTVTPDVSIVGDSSICLGSSVTFTATPVNGGSNPSYQWKVNGANAGTNSNTFTTTGLKDGDIVTVQMTSNATCILTPDATSNPITMNVTKIDPSVSITSTDNSVCAGSTITFTAVAVNGGTNPTYTWKVNGVDAGTDSSTFTSNTLKDGDVVTVELLSKAACAIDPLVVSNPIKVVIFDMPIVKVNDPASVCSNTVDLTDSLVVAGSDPSLVFTYWKDAQAQVTLPNPDAITQSGTYYIKATSPDGCSAINPVHVSIFTNPKLVITDPETVCEPNAIDLTSPAIVAGSDNNLTYTYWLDSLGTQAVSNPNSVTKAGTYYIKATTVNGCSSIKAVNVTTTNIPVTPSVQIIASSISVCDGSTLVFTAIPGNEGTRPVYQWKVNGNPVGTNSPVFSSNKLSDGDLVTVTLTSNAPCAISATAESNVIKLTAEKVDPAVSIQASATTICFDGSVTFTATPQNGGTNPRYQWKINGVNAGTNSNIFTPDTLANGDVVSVVLTSNANCINQPNATSTGIPITVIKVIPSVSIVANNTEICEGTSMSFVATPVNGGPSPSYQWQVNGQNVGTNSIFYTTTTLADGDIVTVIMTTSADCSTQPTAISNRIVMKVNSVGDVVVSDAASSCDGVVDLTSTSITAGSSPNLVFTYWRDAEATQILLHPDRIFIPGTYYIKATSPEGCSKVVPIRVDLPSKPTATVGGDQLICKGNSTNIQITLTGTAPWTLKYSDGTTEHIVNQIMTNNYQLNVNPEEKTTYTFSSIVDAYCTSIQTLGSVTVDVEDPIDGMRLPDVRAFAYVQKQLHGRNLGIDYLYQWSPGTGLNLTSIYDPVYNYDRSTLYTITMTSKAGCIAVDTMLVNVVNEGDTTLFSNIFVPKAWTPNGDGKNDYLYPLTVHIRTLTYFRIFNRWGQLMFETSTIGKGWDGLYRGKPQVMDAYTWTVEAIGDDGKHYKFAGNSALAPLRLVVVENYTDFPKQELRINLRKPALESCFLSKT